MIVEETTSLEEAEYAALQRALEAVDVVCSEVRRLVEGDGATVGLGEDAVEDDDMEVEVRVEGRAEAVQEGDGAELKGVPELTPGADNADSNSGRPTPVRATARPLQSLRSAMSESSFAAARAGT